MLVGIFSSMPLVMDLPRSKLRSQIELDVALGRTDADADLLALVAPQLAVAHVAHGAGAELADAGEADAHAAAVVEAEPLILADLEDRRGAVGLHLDVALEELHGPALAGLGAGEDVLEALDVEVVAVPVLLPVLLHGVEHPGGAAHKRLALVPVRAQLVELARLEMAHLLGLLQVELEAVVLAVDLLELLAEDDLVLRAGGVEVDGVVQHPVALERAEHAHDGGDPAARGDEEELLRDLVGEREAALHSAQAQDRAGLELLVEVGRDGAVLHELRRDGDHPVLAVGIRGQRVGAPVQAAVDDHADAEVLPGLVALPLEAGLDRDRDRVLGLVLDPLYAPAQLASRPQRVYELEVVVRKQGREERARRVERAPLPRRNLRLRAELSHLLVPPRPRRSCYP